MRKIANAYGAVSGFYLGAAIIFSQHAIEAHQANQELNKLPQTEEITDLQQDQHEVENDSLRVVLVGIGFAAIFAAVAHKFEKEAREDEYEEAKL